MRINAASGATKQNAANVAEGSFGNGILCKSGDLQRVGCWPRARPSPGQGGAHASVDAGQPRGHLEAAGGRIPPPVLL
jgi:hypothetical protein